MLTAREQQHSFSTHERMFLWKFLRQKMYPPERDSNTQYNNIHYKVREEITYSFLNLNGATVEV